MSLRKAKSFVPFVILPAAAIAGALTIRPVPAAEPGHAVDAATVAQTKALYAEKCGACHNLPAPEEKGYNRQEWQRTVDKMLNKYGASTSISGAEAAQIVDYLATFAPKAGAMSHVDRWATDRVDVWTVDPAATFVTNFESDGQMAHLSPLVSGAKGPKAIWKVAQDKGIPNGRIAKVTCPGADAGHFVLLSNPRASGHDVDITVRFRIDSAKASPAVGIAFGVQNAKDYQLVRYDGARNALSLMRIQEPVHQTLQKTDIATGSDLMTVALPSAAPGAAPVTPAVPETASAFKPDGQWHKLRVLAHGGTVRAWLDMTKRISFEDDQYQGGQVAIWSQGDTAASFDDWTTDIYDNPGTPHV